MFGVVYFIGWKNVRYAQVRRKEWHTHKDV